MFESELEGYTGKIVDMQKAADETAYETMYAAFDAWVSTAEADRECRMDKDGMLVVTTADHGSFRVLTSQAVVLFANDLMERWGYHALFGDPTRSPVTVPTYCPYVSPGDTIESLEQYGLHKEAAYLQNAMTRYLTKDSFSATAQPGRFNAATDFHRYEY